MTIWYAYCLYCNKKCVSGAGLASHERRCKGNLKVKGSAKPKQEAILK